MSVYIFCHAAQNINENKKPKFLENCKKTQKMCKNTSDYENNLENCQEIETRMSRPKCTWMSESLSSRHKKIRWGSTFQWGKYTWVLVLARWLAVSLLRKHREPHKGKKTGRLESKIYNTEKLKIKPVIWKRITGYWMRMNIQTGS